MSKIIAIDCGTIKCGLSILERVNRRTILIDSKQLYLKGDLLEERLYFFEEFLDSYIGEFSPQSVALEETFVAPPKVDPKTKQLVYPYCKESPLKLSMARGIVYSMAGKHKIQVYSYMPTKVKKIGAGNAQAGKKMVTRQIYETFKDQYDLWNRKPEEDEADSIAVGITDLCIRGAD